MSIRFTHTLAIAGCSPFLCMLLFSVKCDAGDADDISWYLTGDNRIAITGGNQCLDEGDNGPQTYQCTTGNTNQSAYIHYHPRATPLCNYDVD